MTATTPPVTSLEEIETPTQTAAVGLSDRLDVLDRLVALGEGRIEKPLMDDAAALLARAGERLRLSGEHTVVALAGGTGSGKSSLFNAVCGLELSPTGLRRPMTSSAHSCVWGLGGAGPLMDWLDIDPRHRYARASALDGDGQVGSLQGLVLLDLPDHDSIRAAHLAEVDKYVSVADLIIWVLDPQKYADFAVHRRYFEQLSGHTGVTLIVLNQVDRLEPEEVTECVKDLHRLLEAEGMGGPTILTTSAKTGDGIEGFREILADSVAARQARLERLVADIDRLVRRFEGQYAEAEPPATVDDRRAAALVEALTDAAGVPAVAESMESAYSLRAMDYVGWPLGRLTARLHADPLRRMRLGELRQELRAAFTTPVNAQQAHVDNALQEVTEGVTADLPPSWQRSVREAGRSQAEELPEALGDSLREVVPAFNQIPAWWWIVRAWQYLLVTASALGLLWLGAILAYGGLDLGRAPFGILGDPSLSPYVGLLVLCTLGLGAFTAAAARNVIALSSVRHSERLEEQMRQGIGSSARTLVIEPVERELEVYKSFREEVSTAIRSLMP
ncbi:MAG TPA: ABC transporter [Actinoallomurus sp.]|jgi:GTP-binding protein EngB required for normal cell division